MKSPLKLASRRAPKTPALAIPALPSGPAKDAPHRRPFVSLRGDCRCWRRQRDVRRLSCRPGHGPRRCYMPGPGGARKSASPPTAPWPATRDGQRRPGADGTSARDRRRCTRPDRRSLGERYRSSPGSTRRRKPILQVDQIETAALEEAGDPGGSCPGDRRRGTRRKHRYRHNSGSANQADEDEA